MDAADLRSQGDRDLGERLLADPEIRDAIERFEEESRGAGARRHLLGTAMRLTSEMAPDVHAIVDGCRKSLGIDLPSELYVYPGAFFNAAAVRPEGGRIFVIVSSSLLEAFDPPELSFVVGHELGHHVFEHHQIPVGPLLSGLARIGAGQALALFAWQRYAEISADRAGVFCAGGLSAAASSLFKLASGLRGGRVNVRIDQFLAQLSDLSEEAARLATGDEPPRMDWFATHPFSPLRLRSAELFAGSELMRQGGTPRADLEASVGDLMLLMEPSYLQEHSDVAETMRRLLVAGGVAIAAAGGALEDTAIEALEKLLGRGTLPVDIKPDAFRQDLPRRIDEVKASVPLLRRAQVIRDLCVIAKADGHVTAEEQAVLRSIAEQVGVDPALVSRTIAMTDQCAAQASAAAPILAAPPPAS
ncbi:MAG: M48 family metallopeptidase [Acidobacteriota bacterium]